MFDKTKTVVSEDTEEFTAYINDIPGKEELDVTDTHDGEQKNDDVTDKELDYEDEELDEEDELDDEELEKAFDPAKADEHQVFINVLQAYDEAKSKRDKYKKYGPLFVIISGIVFLALIFTLSRKIEFLILWVITDLICVALMIRAEYVFNQFKEILGIIKKEDEEDYLGEEAE